MSENATKAPYVEALGEKPSIAEQIYYMAYVHGNGATAPRFDVMTCPDCVNEFVQVIRDTPTERQFLCHNCLQIFGTPKRFIEAA